MVVVDVLVDDLGDDLVVDVLVDVVLLEVDEDRGVFGEVICPKLLARCLGCFAIEKFVQNYSLAKILLSWRFAYDAFCDAFLLRGDWVSPMASL